MLAGKGFWAVLFRGVVSLVGAAVLTLLTFLVLPLMQTISNPVKSDLVVRNVDLGLEPPPPPPPPAEEEPEPEQDEPPPPELTEQAQPLDLSQLELALNPGSGEGVMGDFQVNLFDSLQGGESDRIDQIFSLSDLDQRPRVIFQRAPTYPVELRRQGKEGTVYVVFHVDVTGRVVDPKVQQSSDPAFERPALEAVKQWRFEPGKRKGEKVPFKMRVPIRFSAT